MGERITVERDGHVLLIGLNRPDKRNAADMLMLRELAVAYGVLHREEDLRVGLVHAHGDHFTGGLDLADVAGHLADGALDSIPEGGIDPWGLRGDPVGKPVVVAVEGICLTLGIELILAADIAVAGASARFAQIEVARGLLPFGGATIRLVQRAGWGRAMRWLLTGEYFGSPEALEMGLVSEVVEDGAALDRAAELAHTVAAQAPLAVQATLANARMALEQSERAAAEALPGQLARLMGTEDLVRGLSAFASRTTAQFVGR